MSAMTRQETERVLVAVDGSTASERAARYVGRMLRARDDTVIRLLHVLPCIRSDVLAPASVSASEHERRARDAEDEERMREAIEEARREAVPLMKRLHEILVAEGIDERRIETAVLLPAPGESVARRILMDVRERDCQTVVLARDTYPWWRELFVGRVGEKVLHEAGVGRTVWIVG